MRACLGDDHPEVDRILAERIVRFRKIAADGSTIGGPERAAVRAAAARVPVGIVSGDYRDEIDLLIGGAGLSAYVEFVVSIEDVDRPKPDPAQYLLALELLGDGIQAGDVVAFEDSPSVSRRRKAPVSTASGSWGRSGPIGSPRQTRSCRVSTPLSSSASSAPDLVHQFVTSCSPPGDVIFTHIQARPRADTR